jgi:hypothetical protein
MDFLVKLLSDGLTVKSRGLWTEYQKAGPVSGRHYEGSSPGADALPLAQLFRTRVSNRMILPLRFWRTGHAGDLTVAA